MVQQQLFRQEMWLRFEVAGYLAASSLSLCKADWLSGCGAQVLAQDRA